MPKAKPIDKNVWNSLIARRLGVFTTGVSMPLISVPSQALQPLAQEYLINPFDDSLRFERDGQHWVVNADQYKMIEGVPHLIEQSIDTDQADKSLINPLWVLGGALAVGGAGAAAAAFFLNAQGNNDDADPAELDIGPRLTVPSVIEVAENSSGVLLTVAANSPSDLDLSFSLSGEDSSLFEIDAVSGQLSLRSTSDLDFDSPTDQNANNEYELTVLVLDAAGESSSQTVTIRVTNLDDEAPEIAASSTTIVVDENFSGKVADIALADVDSEMSDIVWSVSGDDASFFEVASGGELRLKSGLDFEVPADADGDGLYQLSVQASDPAGNQSGELNYRVTIQNVWEPGSANFSVLTSQVLDDLQSASFTPVVDAVSFAQAFYNQDLDGDGDADALFVFADNDGVDATGDVASILVGAYDGLNESGGVDPIWIFSDTNASYAQLHSVTSSRNADGTGHELIVNTATAEWSLQTLNASVDKSTPLKSSHGNQERVVLRDDWDGNGTTDSFWVIDAEGIKRGAGPDGSPTDLLLTTPTFDAQQIYASGDLNADGVNDLVVYSSHSDQLNSYIYDEVSNSLHLASDHENPFHGVSIGDLTSSESSPTGISLFDPHGDQAVSIGFQSNNFLEIFS